MPLRLDLLPRLRAPGYLILGLLCLQPLLELVMGGWPPRPGIAAWRLSFLSTASGALLIPLVGLFLIHVLALLLGDRRVGAAIAFIALLVALLSLVAAGEFILDAMQMRAQIQPEAADRYRVASGWVVVKYLVAMVASLALARSALRAGRVLRHESKHSAPKPSSVFLRETQPDAAVKPEP